MEMQSGQKPNPGSVTHSERNMTAAELLSKGHGVQGPLWPLLPGGLALGRQASRMFGFGSQLGFPFRRDRGLQQTKTMLLKGTGRSPHGPRSSKDAEI